jgi:hypothetical protein
MSLPTVGSTKLRLAAFATAVLGYVLIGGGLHSFTWPAMVWTTLGGLAIFLVAWRGGRSPASAPASRTGAITWTVWLAAVTGWELWALSMHPRSSHPTISSLLDGVVDTYAGRSVALLAWLALGWWLARR